MSKAYGKFLKLNQPIFDATLSALKRDLAAIGAAKDAAGLNIVDIASGPGQPTLTIAEAFPGASITCTDISPDMVQSAKVRADALRKMKTLPTVINHSTHHHACCSQGNLASAKNVKFAVVDASDLSAFPDASFDVVRPLKTSFFCLCCVPSRRAQKVPFSGRRRCCASPASSYAQVTCVFGVMFVPDCEKALREFRRVLKPQGAFPFSSATIECQ